MDIPEEPKYKGLPRRYEETKPALEQVFTHNSILQVGERILGSYEANSAKLRQAAVAKCEDRVWEEAEVYKDKCVKIALQQAAERESQRVQDLNEQHDLQLQEEIARVTELMRQQNVDGRYEERKVCENRTQLLLQQLKKKNELEKNTDVKAARIEEQAVANSNTLDMMQRHEEAMTRLREEMEEAKITALAALQYKLDDLRNEAVQKAREEEREIAEQSLKEVLHFHKIEADDSNAALTQLATDKQRLEANLEAMTEERDEYVSKFNNLQNEFTNFIENCRPDFSSGQADFLLPSS